MRRPAEKIAASVVLVLAAASIARAELPRGELLIRGTERTSASTRALDGTLTIAPATPGLFALTRRVKSAGGSSEVWNGIAQERDGALFATLTAVDEGLVQGLDFMGPQRAPRTVRAIYRSAKDGSLQGTGAGASSFDEVARPRVSTARMSKDEYFAFLDRDPAFRELSKKDALAGLLALLDRTDVPPAVERAYTKKAGSVGGGRILLALDYTRGIEGEPTWWEAVKSGPTRVLTSKILTPMLTHFRYVDGVSLFPGDVGFTPAFRDSALTSEKTNQVGHFLCALESGVRLGQMQKHPFEKKAFELALRVTSSVVGPKGVEPTVEDWSRAGIIGHEMVSDEGGSGFLGQMNTYAKLVANGDPDRIRQRWDDAVAAVLAGRHVDAWRDIRAIAKAAEIPETADDAARNLANPTPRFAKPGVKRDGNSLADLALSVYGFALGQKSATTGYATAADARADLAAFLAAGGAQAREIELASLATR